MPHQHLTTAQKRQLCEIKESVSKTSLSQLQQHARQLFNFSPSKSAIARMWKDKEHWLKANRKISGSRHRAHKWPRLETELDMWFNQTRRLGSSISGPLITEKAKGLATELGITDFNGSNGWLHNFKKRHGIPSFKIHGEASSADMTGVELAQELLPKLKSIEEQGYEPHKTSKMDATSPQHGAHPDKTLTKEAVPDHKVAEEHVTVGLKVNSTGPEFITLSAEVQPEAELIMEEILEETQEDGNDKEEDETPPDVDDLNGRQSPTVTLIEAQHMVDRLEIFMMAHPISFDASKMSLFRKEFSSPVTSLVIANSGRLQ